LLHKLTATAYVKWPLRVLHSSRSCTCQWRTAPGYHTDRSMQTVQ